MVNSNVNALGVIFANTYDNLVPELVAERSMASIPFGGRYRLIDFTLSSMANICENTVFIQEIFQLGKIGCIVSDRCTEENVVTSPEIVING